MSTSNGSPDRARCAACGARNVREAVWCTQCYAALGADVGPSPTDPAGASPGVPAGASPGGVPAGPASGDPVVPPAAAVQRDIRDLGEGVIEWRCATCDGWTGLGQGSCGVCGSPRQGFGADVTGQLKPVDPARALSASLVLPGVGHVLAGAVGSGSARILLALFWAGGAVTLLRGGTSGALPGGILVAGALALWVATAIDVRRLAEGRRDQLLDGRGLAGLVVVVTLLLVGGSVVTAPRGGSPSRPDTAEAA